MKQQRCDEILLVQRVQDVNRVEHPVLVRVGQFLEKRLHRREIGDVEPHVGRLHVLAFEPLADGRHVAPPDDDREGRPDGHQGQDDVAELGPRQRQPPRLDEEQEQETGRAPREAIHRDVEKLLRLTLVDGGSGRKKISRVVLSTE